MKQVAIKGKYKPKNKKKFIGSRLFDPTYRSMWERRFMLYCDRSESILYWDSESIAIPYRSPRDDKMHTYYPDFYIDYLDKDGNKKIAIIEIKPKFQCRWDVNIAKWKAAKHYCDEHGWEFKVLTEKELF